MDGCERVIVFGLLVYLVYWFISPLILSLENVIVSGLLVYLVYWFISPLTISLKSGIVSGLLIYLVTGLFHHRHFHSRVG